MKRRWELHELIEEWTLIPRELELLGNKTGPTRLGYAVLLKYFQREGRFPESVDAIAPDVLRHLSLNTLFDRFTALDDRDPRRLKSI